MTIITAPLSPPTPLHLRLDQLGMVAPGADTAPKRGRRAAEPAATTVGSMLTAVRHAVTRTCGAHVAGGAR